MAQILAHAADGVIRVSLPAAAARSSVGDDDGTGWQSPLSRLRALAVAQGGRMTVRRCPAGVTLSRRGMGAPAARDRGDARHQGTL